MIKFHSDKYFCPTCEKLVSDGYGLNMADNNIVDEWRKAYNSFNRITNLNTLEDLIIMKKIKSLKN